MRIAPSLIANYITPNADAQISVRHPSGQAVMLVLRAEALALAASQAICGIANKHGYIKHFELLISARAAHRIVKQISKGGCSIAAEDNYTVVRTPGGTFSHHMARSSAYARG